MKYRVVCALNKVYDALDSGNKIFHVNGENAQKSCQNNRLLVSCIRRKQLGVS